MANWFIDTSLATGLNNGTSMDDAWQNWTGLEGLGFAAGDIIWVRRRSVQVATAQIDITDDGAGNNPIIVIGWPRNSSTGTGSIDQGERVMYGLGTISADKEKHLTRNVKVDANGTYYMISAIIQKLDYVSETGTFTEGLMVTGAVSGATGMIHKLVDAGTTGSLYIVLKGSTNFNASEAITDTDTGAATSNGAESPDGFALEMRYVGTTVSSGAITIAADDDYALAQAIVDTTWTIKKTDYNSDPDDLPKMDFTTTAYYLYHSGAYHWVYRNLHIIAGTAAYVVYLRSAYTLLIEHCLMETVGNTVTCRVYHSVSNYVCRYVIFIGSGTGTSNNGIYANQGICQLEHFAIYNFGNHGINLDSTVTELQLNIGTIGVMLPNGDDDLDIIGLRGIERSCDVELGGGVNEVQHTYFTPTRISSKLKGYQQILGDHMMGGVSSYVAISTDVVAGSGDPQKRSGGADKIITWPTVAHDVYEFMKNDSVFGMIVLEHHIKADTTSKNYRYYVQAEAALGTEELILFCEYVDEYYSAGVYHRTVSESSQSIAIRSGTTDWSQYVEVTGIQPAVASEVRLWIQIAGNGGYAEIHIDPQVVIS